MESEDGNELTQGSIKRPRWPRLFLIQKSGKAPSTERGMSLPKDRAKPAENIGTADVLLRDGRDAIQLERKEDMKRRGLASSDDGDALAPTFAYPVAAIDRTGSAGRLHQFEYDPFAQAWDQLAGQSGPRVGHAEAIRQMQSMRRLHGLP